MGRLTFIMEVEFLIEFICSVVHLPLLLEQVVDPLLRQLGAHVLLALPAFTRVVAGVHG